MYTKIEVLGLKFKKELDNFLEKNKNAQQGQFGYTGLKPRSELVYTTDEPMDKIIWELTAGLSQVITATIQFGSFGFLNANGKPNPSYKKSSLETITHKMAYNAIITDYDSNEQETLANSF
jgi:hypothetical protein